MWGKGKKFSLGHVEFWMLKDIHLEIMSRSFYTKVWVYERMVWTKDINLGIAAVYMVFKAMSLDEITN